MTDATNKYRWRHFKRETPDNGAQIIFENDGVICEGLWLDFKKHILVSQKNGVHQVYHIAKDTAHNIRFWMYKPNFERANLMLEDTDLICDLNADTKEFHVQKESEREMTDETSKYRWRDGLEEQPEDGTSIFFYQCTKLEEGVWEDGRIHEIWKDSKGQLWPLKHEFCTNIRYWMYKPPLPEKLHCCVREDIECKDDGDKGLFRLILNSPNCLAKCLVEYCPICGEKASEKK